MGLPDFVHALVPHSLAQCHRIDDVGEHDRQSDTLITRPFEKSRAAGFGISRQDEGIEVPLPIRRQVHQFDL
jgi:hypothetical protein